jgi:hypothetical protein
VNWLVRQLKDSPDTLRIDTFTVNGRSVASSALLRDVRESPQLLVGDAKKEIRAFRLVQSAAMGTKRGKGRGSFIGSVLGVLDSFYEVTAQNLRPWAPSAPKVRPVPEQVDAEADDQGVPGSLVSTAASSQDGPVFEAVEARARSDEAKAEPRVGPPDSTWSAAPSPF